MDPAAVLPLIEQIYDASLETSRWQGFVDALSEAYGGAPTGYALQLPGAPLSGVFFASTGGFADEFQPTFAHYVTRGLPWEEARRNQFVGRFGLASEVVSAERIAESDFYLQWMKPQGLADHGPIGHTVALDGGRPVAGIAIFPQEGRAPFTMQDLGFADQLVPHLARAYAIHATTRRQHALSKAIDRFPTGLVLLDARGQVLHANRLAVSLLADGDGLSLHEGALRASDPDDQRLLQRYIQFAISAAADGEARNSDVLAIRRRSEGRAYPAMVAPLRPDEGDATLPDAVAVIYFSDLDEGTLRRREALNALYGLTEAETHLVELLCQGCSLDEAAEARGVTVNTARSQLKQVFAKTHTGRQSELVRLVLSGVASIGGP
ncbi:MAG: hypothetical protein AAF430_23175 [Myxococcota bacterium]